jgi:hypothetical protein
VVGDAGVPRFAFLDFFAMFNLPMDLKTPDTTYCHLSSYIWVSLPFSRSTAPKSNMCGATAHVCLVPIADGERFDIFRRWHPNIGNVDSRHETTLAPLAGPVSGRSVVRG